MSFRKGDLIVLNFSNENVIIGFYVANQINNHHFPSTHKSCTILLEISSEHSPLKFEEKSFTFAISPSTEIRKISPTEIPLYQEKILQNYSFAINWFFYFKENPAKGLTTERKAIRDWAKTLLFQKI